MSIPTHLLSGKTILITGAAGLIGSALVRTLMNANERDNLTLSVIACVRDRRKAERVFGAYAGNSALTFCETSIENFSGVAEHVDFIVHAASPTSSRYFVEKPVETILTAVNGTRNVLEFARTMPGVRMVYLSSMEVYGTPDNEELITETSPTNVNPMKIRSCYPEAKRLCESLCTSYCAEYGVETMVVRLAQTFGPGIPLEDKRVFAQFARCVLDREDIRLLTDGASKCPYMDTSDAVSAILTVLVKGVKGEAYNAGNPNNYCSIADMARMTAKELANGEIQVILRAETENIRRYPDTYYLNLAIEKLQKLGWEPLVPLREMYVRMIEEMKAHSGAAEK